jgi:hypothetical protein
MPLVTTAPILDRIEHVFDSPRPEQGPAGEGEPFSAAGLAAAAARLRAMAPASGESEHIDRIRLLEELKAVCAPER